MISNHTSDVEVDIYTELLPDIKMNLYIGIDIGSTSTKAILTDETGKPVAGFYSYTVGKPLSAVRALMETIEDLFTRHKTNFKILGVGTSLVQDESLLARF